MEITYRKATMLDFDKINQLFIEMLQTIYGKEQVKGYNLDELNHYFNNEEDWICIAEINNEIVGYLSIEVHHKMIVIFTMMIFVLRKVFDIRELEQL